MRNLVVAMCSFLFTSTLAQRLDLNNKLFQNIQESSIFKYYSGKILVTLWVYKDIQAKGIDIDTSYYGFYDSCDLPNLNSLKDSGINYFEVNSIDFIDETSRKANLNNICGQLNIYTEDKDTMISVYYSSRQQYVTYEKVDALPKNVQEHLEKKGIKLK